METHLILKVLACIGSGIAMVTDMRTGLIFNWLTFPMMFLGWGLNLYFFGVNGFLLSFAATVLGIVLYMPFASIGAIGMGDVKLLGGIGAIAGSSFVVVVFLGASIIGIFHALFIQYLNYGKNWWGMLLASYMTGAFKEKNLDDGAEDKKKYKYYLGLDIFLASLAAIFLDFSIKF
ncbi:MAG: prepilin peptidase [Candidatus Riflebacteria bacterium]|nr:prepilin peptidase [Candidatus Riflebacteria bacterium]